MFTFAPIEFAVFSLALSVASVVIGIKSRVNMLMTTSQHHNVPQTMSNQIVPVTVYVFAFLFGLATVHSALTVPSDTREKLFVITSGAVSTLAGAFGLSLRAPTF